jgi:hypothetical protein
MQLTIRPANGETHHELERWRYPPPHDFLGADAHACSRGHVEPPV